MKETAAGVTVRISRNGTPKPQVNVGIVGLGKMGILHAGILNALPNSCVVAVAEKEGMLIRFAKKLLPGIHFYSKVEDMLSKEEELDAIYITTPISTHRQIVDAIASSHRPIGLFVEKPLAGTYEDAREMASHSRELGSCNMVGFQKRFSPIFRKGLEFLNQGVLGDLNSFSAYSYVSGFLSESKGWRMQAGQGGALLDLGPHLVDTLVWYFGKPASVSGSLRSLHSRDVDDSAKGELTFKSGLLGKFEVSWSKEGYRLPEVRIEVSGKNGMMRVSDDYLQLEIASDTKGLAKGIYRFRKPEFDMQVDFLIGDPEYCIEDKYFLECLRKDIEPEPSFADGVVVNKIIEEVSQSSIERIETS